MAAGAPSGAIRALPLEEKQRVAPPRPDYGRGYKAIGFEALARWDHPLRGLLTPGQFAPALEHSQTSMMIWDAMLTTEEIKALVDRMPELDNPPEPQKKEGQDPERLHKELLKNTGDELARAVEGGRAGVVSLSCGSVVGDSI